MGERGCLILLAATGLLIPAVAGARGVHERALWDAPGSLVQVSVEVDGRLAPLYPSPDGSARRYVEARRGSSYSVRIENRTGERLGVAMSVDGLNVISGIETSAPRSRRPGRMYVLDPWGETVVRGWRTSLEEIRRFTFVDESASYAARSGKANPKMGWIEIAVYRQRRPYVVRGPLPPWEPRAHDEGRRGESAAGEGDAAASRPTRAPEAADSRETEGRAKSSARAPYTGYPGTGWGSRGDDPAQVVSFDPQPVATETVTLRYEYAGALRALGILPRPDYGRDRLRERERGEWGFAAPPAW
jgi:hypothetical protein